MGCHPRAELASLISVQELAFMAAQVAGSTSRVFEVWISVSLMYFTLCFGLALMFGRLESRNGPRSHLIRPIGLLLPADAYHRCGPFAHRLARQAQSYSQSIDVARDSGRLSGVPACIGVPEVCQIVS
jgi:hypothetical protein